MVKIIFKNIAPRTYSGRILTSLERKNHRRRYTIGGEINGNGTIWFTTPWFLGGLNAGYELWVAWKFQPEGGLLILFSCLFLQVFTGNLLMHLQIQSYKVNHSQPLRPSYPLVVTLNWVSFLLESPQNTMWGYGTRKSQSKPLCG